MQIGDTLSSFNGRDGAADAGVFGPWFSAATVSIIRLAMTGAEGNAVFSSKEGRASRDSQKARVRVGLLQSEASTNSATRLLRS